MIACPRCNPWDNVANASLFRTNTVVLTRRSSCRAPISKFIFFIEAAAFGSKKGKLRVRVNESVRSKDYRGTRRTEILIILWTTKITSVAFASWLVVSAGWHHSLDSCHVPPDPASPRAADAQEPRPPELEFERYFRAHPTAASPSPWSTARPYTNP